MKRTLNSGVDGNGSGSSDESTQHDNLDKPPLKRPRATIAGASGLDLVYPYWYQVNTSEITPPLIDPNGPIYDNNGMLNIRLNRPLSVVDRGVGVLTDATLGVTEDGKLGVVIDSEGPLSSTEDGLTIRTNDSLELDVDWDLGVRFAPVQPFDIRPCGIVLNIDDTLLVDQNPETEDYELGVHLSHEGPLTSDEHGLDIDFDDSLKLVELNGAKALAVNLHPPGPLMLTETGITLNTDISLGVSKDGELGLKLNTDGALSFSESGLTLVTDKTLGVVTDNGISKLGVKLNDGGPLLADGNGLLLLYNTRDFRNDATKGLTLTKDITYLSPYSCLKSGSPALDNFGARVRSDTARYWPCAYYLYLANSSGIVNGLLRVRVDRHRITDVGSGARSSLSFTFVIDVNESQGFTHSQMGAITTTPPNTSSSYVPDAEADQTEFSIAGPNSEWFSRHNGQIREFQPLGINFMFTPGKYSYWVARNVDNNQRVVVLSVSVNTGTSTNDWYTTRNGSIVTGELPVSFQGNLVHI